MEFLLRDGLAPGRNFLVSKGRLGLNLAHENTRHARFWSHHACL
jgi:hypothetical protein